MTTPEQEWEYWNTKSDELRRTQLETVQKAASNWSTLFGGLVGVFGVVSFAGGLTTIDKLGSPWDNVAVGLTIGSAILWVVATYLCAQASGDLAPGQAADVDPTSLQMRASASARLGLQQLKTAKRVGGLGVLFVLAGSCVVLVAGEGTEAKKPPTVVAVVDGASACGVLSSSAEGTLTVGDVSLSAGVESITIVPKCP